jgi:hypothetical protein
MWGGVMPLLQTTEVLNKLDTRMGNAAVGCHYGVNGLTVHFIRKVNTRSRGVPGPLLHQGQNFLVCIIIQFAQNGGTGIVGMTGR